MTDTKEEITIQKNVEEIEKLKAEYETSLATIEQKNLQLENLVIKKNDEIFELQQANKNLAEERDSWKKEAHQNRRIYQAEAKTKQETDFLSELAKLQAQKGININA